VEVLGWEDLVPGWHLCSKRGTAAKQERANPGRMYLISPTPEKMMANTQCLKNQRQLATKEPKTREDALP